MKVLFIRFFFFTGLAIFMLVAGIYEHMRLAGDRPTITLAEELRDRHGQSVRIGAELAYTNISLRYTERQMGQRGGSTRTWYLHIIEFEDAAVAFRSIHSDIHTRELVYGRVEAAPAGSIYARLWRQYDMANMEIFPYAVRFYNINTSGDMLTGGLILLPVGAFFGVILFFVKKMRK